MDLKLPPILNSLPCFSVYLQNIQTYFREARTLYTYLLILFALVCCVGSFLNPHRAFVLLYSCTQKQQLELKQLHSDYECLRTQEHHKSRQLEELT